MAEKVELGSTFLIIHRSKTVADHMETSLRMRTKIPLDLKCDKSCRPGELQSGRNMAGNRPGPSRRRSLSPK